MEGEFSGYLPNPIEVITDLPQLANWLMDVVLDWQIYKQSQSVLDENNKINYIDVTPENIRIKKLHLKTFNSKYCFYVKG